MESMEQKNPRVEFNSTGVRPDSIYALRWMLRVKGIEEGEFLSQLFERAVIDAWGDGECVLNLVKDAYLRELEALRNE